MEVVLKTIDSGEGLADVYGLTYREYLKAGYIQPKPDKMLSHYAQLDGIPETTVFGAYIDGKLVGTNSLTVDGPMELPVDHDFPDQTRRMRGWCRSRGLALGGAWRIVTCSSSQRSLAVVRGLVQVVLRRGCDLGLHVTLYSVHPVLERVYQRFLGLETIARDVCQAMGGSPAVLMYGDSRNIVKRCPTLMQPCLEKCSPPRWPRNTGTWTRE